HCVDGGTHPPASAALDRMGTGDRLRHRPRRARVRLPVPDQPYRASASAGTGRRTRAECLRVRSRRVPGRGRLDHADPDRAGAPDRPQPPPASGRRIRIRCSTQARDRLMELVISLAIGVLFGSGIWLVLRPHSFQVLTGLMLMSYAVNLFIFIMGRLWVDKAPLTLGGGAVDPAMYSDPL